MTKNSLVASVTVFGILLFPISLQAAASNCQNFLLRGGSMSVPVQIRGEEYSAIITTSNIPASISQGLVDRLNLNERRNPNLRLISDTGRPQAFRYVKDVPATLFGFETEFDELAITDSESLYLTLSLRVFSGLLIQINFPEEEICFLNREAIDLVNSQNIQMNSSASSGTPVVFVTVNGEFETWLDFQPGFPGGIRVDRFVSNSLGLEPDSDEDNSDSEYSKSAINSLAFGPYDLGGIPVDFPKRGVRSNLTERRQTLTNTHIQEDQQSRGSIGFEVLRHFIVTLDLELERMHIYAPPP